MRLLNDADFSGLIESSFEKDVLKSAYSHLHNLHDPLRCNIFALLIRELIRIVIARLAPDDNVSQASWCHDERITRRSRYRFVITGMISDAQIAKHPKLNATDAIAELVRLNDTLSKYTHISSGTYNATQSQVDQFVREVEDVVIEYVQTLKKTKDEIRNIMWTIVSESVNQHVSDAIPAELDMLSGQTIVENIHVEQLEDFDTTTLTPTLTGSGMAEIELNYGHGDEQMSSSDSYPLTFEVEIDPDTFEVSVSGINVDTSSFYE